MRWSRQHFPLTALLFYVTSTAAILDATTVTSSYTSTISLVARPAASTCQSRSINYITHTLPQQCLKTSRNGVPNSSTRSQEPADSTRLSDPSVASSSQEAGRAGAAVDGGSGPESSQTSAPSGNHSSQVNSSASVSTEPVSPPSDASSLKHPSPTASDSLETDSDSPLDNAKFLSFEEWKKQNLARAGQSAEELAGRDANAPGPESRRRPGSLVALDTLGDDAEIDLDFGGFVSSYESISGRRRDGKDSESRTDAKSGEGESGTDNRPTQRQRSKDAGTTCKERFNYASFDCAATVLKTNPRSRGSSSVLVENKDSYMLNECSAKNKFIIVELCEDILVDTIVLANFEFFSSMFHQFRVSVSDRYPVKMDRWKELGTFEARNSRAVQAFLIENSLIWAKFLRVEFLTHYGNEFYCPLSLLRVHGTTMMEEFRHQEDANRGEDEAEEDQDEVAAGDKNSEPQTVTADAVLHESQKSKAKAALSTDSSSQPESPTTTTEQSSQPTIVKDEESDASTTSTTNSEESLRAHLVREAIEQQLWGFNMSNVDICQLDTTFPNHDNDGESTEAPDKSGPTPSASVEASAPVPPSNETKLPKPAVSTPQSQHKDDPSATQAVSSATNTNSTTQDAPKPSPSSTQPAPANPTTQESFFKSIHKRLQLLEANATLSLQYIEEQSQILRDAFTKVEKRQLGKTTTFLENLNATLLTELKGFRQQYDQIWQSTVIELENQREHTQREIIAVSARLSILADELIFQKRMSMIQLLLFILCLGLVMFSRTSSTNYLELPLVQSMMNRSQSTLKLPFETPGGSPPSTRPSSSRRDDTPFPGTHRHRRHLSDESVVTPTSPILEFSPPTPPSDTTRSDEGDRSASLSPQRRPDPSPPGPTTHNSLQPQSQSSPATPTGSRKAARSPLSWHERDFREAGLLPGDAEVDGVNRQRNHASPLRHAEAQSSNSESGEEEEELNDARRSVREVGNRYGNGGSRGVQEIVSNGL
ncbi:MAG: hypothetical protein M1833_000059 [Piccolia ochrophora]|nr:MAG: hypothetical protein M1833_000059 [Piccolia ochrophora]